MTDPVSIFDRRAVRRNRDRAARSFGDHDFLMREVGERLADRLLDVKRAFSAVLDLGCHDGTFARLIGDRGGIETLVQCDLSPAMAARTPGLVICGDEEALPVRDDAFDLVVSNLSLHWVNDLPGALVQINRALKPDGLFLAAMLGGETLKQLRRSLMDAELEARGGVSPRVSPFADVRDLGGLLQRAGFALPVVDSDTVTVTYENALRLMADLRGMGEVNAVDARPRAFTGRSILYRAAQIYQSRHADNDGRIEATFQVLFLHGWVPHPDQQKALRPGSAQTRLATALGTEERPAGDKSAPQ